METASIGLSAKYALLPLDDIDEMGNRAVERCITVQNAKRELKYLILNRSVDHNRNFWTRAQHSTSPRCSSISYRTPKKVRQKKIKACKVDTRKRSNVFYYRRRTWANNVVILIRMTAMPYLLLAFTCGIVSEALGVKIATFRHLKAAPVIGSYRIGGVCPEH